MSDEFPQIANGGIDLFQISPSPLARFRLDLAHEGDHVAEVADARFRQIGFTGPFTRPRGHFVNFGLQPAEVSAVGAPQCAPQTNEVGQQ